MQYLGIEIGGTKLQLGVGLGDGTVAGLWRGTVHVASGPEGIRRQIVGAIPELLARSNISKSDLIGVGIGFGGPVDDATHTVIKSHQIEGWDNFPLADWISDIVGLPAVLGNDADVAGLAEALFGAGKGLSPIFYITIGSGIGGGLIINGEIYRGCGRGAAEIGHLSVPAMFFVPHIPAAPIYPSFTKSFESLKWPRASVRLEPRITYLPLEEAASGWAIARSARSEIYGPIDPESALYRLVLGQKERITSAQVAEAAIQGDRFAGSIFRDVCEHLATGITQVITLLCPRRIVIGGGVSLAGDDLLFNPLRAAVAERVFKPFADRYDIVPAALGEEVVVHGALALARKRLSS
jgi:glucokinase